MLAVPSRPIALPSWLVVAVTLASCAHAGGAARDDARDPREAAALAAALEHPTPRDRPLLEAHLGRLESRARTLRAPGERADLARQRIAVLAALEQLALERSEAFHAAASDPAVDPGMRAPLRASAEAASAECDALRRRSDDALASALAEFPDAPEAARWWMRRLELAAFGPAAHADGVASEALARSIDPGVHAAASLGLAGRALQAGDGARAFAFLRRAFRALGDLPPDGSVPTRLRPAALALVPAIYVAAQPRDTLTLEVVERDLRSLLPHDRDAELRAELRLGVADAAREVDRRGEATLLLRGIADRTDERADRACEARGRLASLRLASGETEGLGPWLVTALEAWSRERELERGTERERRCRAALLGPSLVYATRRYRHALGLPAEARLGARVPEAVGSYDRDAMRALATLLTAVVAAFPDLHAGELDDPDLAALDTVALDAVRRVVDDAILATDPTPPPAPRRHPPRRRGHGRGRRR